MKVSGGGLSSEGRDDDRKRERWQTREQSKHILLRTTVTSLLLEEFDSREKVFLFLVLQHQVRDKTDPQCLQ